MIIKEKSIKSHASLENVLRYLFSKHGHGNSFAFTRYIKGDRRFEKQLQLAQGDTEAISILMEKRLQEMKRQFLANDGQRLHKRKGGTKFYHAILSFHRADSLTREQLLSVARKYTKERFPDSMVVAINHADTEHQHLHLIGSAVEYGTHTTRYLTRSQFRDIKKEMEQWQDRELGLVHSRVDHGKKKTDRFSTKWDSRADRAKNSNYRCSWQNAIPKQDPKGISIPCSKGKGSCSTSGENVRASRERNGSTASKPLAIPQSGYGCCPLTGTKGHNSSTVSSPRGCRKGSGTTNLNNEH